MGKADWVITITDRGRCEEFSAWFQEQGIPLVLTTLGRGTATTEILDCLGLEDTEKGVLFCVTGQAGRLVKKAARELWLDVPGRGVMMTVPLSGIGGVSRPGIVHRIDKDTAGLLVVAKNDAAHLSLSDQLQRHEVSRIYSAIVIGTPREQEGTVDAPLGRDDRDRKRMAVIKDPSRSSKEAVTHYTVLESYSGFSLVRCRLETGRTHQIRVHMSYIGHPLMGDVTYGGGRTQFEKTHSKYINGQCLFAGELSLTHPRSGQRMTFTVPRPHNFEALLQILRNRDV